jgi:immune inhibitor A
MPFRACFPIGDTMRNSLASLLVIILSTLLASTLFAMPLSPELVEKLTAEGRLEEEALVMRDAYQRGVNNPPRIMSLQRPHGIQGVTGSLLEERNAVVILVDFSDNVADEVAYPPAHYDSMLFSEGVYPTGSMNDYFIENSYGQMTVDGDITPWLRMPETYDYYVDGKRGLGTYPQNAQNLAEDAVIAADPYVDFSQFDNDGPDEIPNSGDDDGFVDGLFIVHAGPGYEETGDPNDIHSHQWNTTYPVPVDGVYVSTYSMEPDNGRIGVFAHEYGHVIGLPDLYDYDYDARGVGYWSLMASGSWANNQLTPVHFDAWCKSKLGFLTPVVLTSNSTSVVLEKIETAPVAYIFWTNGIYSREYFIAENRQPVLFDAYIKGTGLVIYHVDENAPNNDEQCCGTCTPHYLVAVEQADGECDLENNANYGDPGDPYPGVAGANNPNHTFNFYSDPKSLDYLGNDTQVALIEIFPSGENMTLRAVVENKPAINVTYKQATEVPLASDGDGLVEPGESVSLSVELLNYGIDAVGVGAKLTESDPYVTLVMDTVFYGDLNENDRRIGQPFELSVDAGCPVPHGAVLDMTITDASGYSKSEKVFVGIGDVVKFYDWTHAKVTSGYGDQWHLSTERNHTTGGTSSWKCGDTGTGIYAIHLDAALYTARFYSGAGTKITFWHWMEAELASGSKAWDGGIVEASLDYGPWQLVTPDGEYPYTIRNGSDCPFPAGTPCFSGIMSAWQYREIDLSSLEGIVQVRFRFGTDGAVGYEGWYIDDVDLVNASLVVGVADERPASFPTQLLSVHPNPFNPSATIRFSASGPTQRLALSIYDVTGRLVRTIESVVLSAGVHEAVWDGNDGDGRATASGVYICRLGTDAKAPGLKLVLLR